MAPAHDPQMVGYRAEEPTSVVYFQQRSHFCPLARVPPPRPALRHRCGSSATWETMNRPGNSPAYSFQQRVQIAIGGEPHTRFQRGADQLLIARGFQALQNIASHFHKTVPIGGAFPCRIVQAGGQARRAPGSSAVCTLPARLMWRPDLFGGEAHDGREQPHQRVQQAVERGLRAAPRFRLGGASIEASFSTSK